jgi:hypothetical protein
MSFIVEKEITLVGIFPQNGFDIVKEGAQVQIVFDNLPGRIYHARIIEIPKGIGHKARSPYRERSLAPARWAEPQHFRPSCPYPRA